MTVWSRIVIMSIVIDVLSKFRFVLNANSNKTLPSVFATIFYFILKLHVVLLIFLMKKYAPGMKRICKELFNHFD